MGLWVNVRVLPNTGSSFVSLRPARVSALFFFFSRCHDAHGFPFCRPRHGGRKADTWPAWMLPLPIWDPRPASLRDSGLPSCQTGAGPEPPGHVHHVWQPAREPAPALRSCSPDGDPGTRLVCERARFAKVSGNWRSVGKCVWKGGRPHEGDGGSLLQVHGEAGWHPLPAVQARGAWSVYTVTSIVLGFCTTDILGRACRVWGPSVHCWVLSSTPSPHCEVTLPSLDNSEGLLTLSSVPWRAGSPLVEKHWSGGWGVGPRHF